jgi:hypothetical protein
MGHGDPPIRHPDYQIPQAQLEARVPVDTQDDDLSVKVPSSEHIFDQDERCISSPSPTGAFAREPDNPRAALAFLVLEYRRREVLHFNVTEHLTSAWVTQQIVEAFTDREIPRYLIRDRDGVYGAEVPGRLNSMGFAEVMTAPQSPWQNV